MNCIDSVKPLRAAFSGKSQNQQSTSTFTVELNEIEAMAFAQFLKRLTWSEMRACAIDEDECYSIKYAVIHMQDSLAQGGFAPR